MAFCTNCGKALPESGVCSCLAEAVPVPPPEAAPPLPSAPVNPPVPPQTEQPVAPSPYPPQADQPVVPPPYPPQGDYPPPSGPGYPGVPAYQPPPPRPPREPSPMMVDLKAICRTYFSPSAEVVTLVACQRTSSFWLLILCANALLAALSGMVMPSILGQTYVHGMGILIGLLSFLIDYVVFIGVFYALFAFTKRKVPFIRFVAAATSAQLILIPVLLLGFLCSFFWPSSGDLFLVLGHVAVCLQMYNFFKATPPARSERLSPFWAIVLATATYLLAMALFGILRDQWVNELAASSLMNNLYGDLGNLGDLFGG